MSPPGERGLTDSATVDRAPHGPGEYIEPVFDLFVKRVSANVSGRLVLVLDAHRSAIYRKVANGESMPADPDRLRFLELARASGIEVIDLEPVFAAHMAGSTLKLEVSPSDGHWNPLAISLVTAAIAERLNRPDAVLPFDASPR